MSGRPQRSGYVTFTAGGMPVRAGFEIPDAPLLAGGPLRLEFSLEITGPGALFLAVSGDRMRQRPGQFEFTSSFEGAPVLDPAGQAPYLGGPMGVVQVTSDHAWRQPLLLNEFLRLEDTPNRITDGATGRLTLSCRRPVALAASEAAALRSETAPALVEVQLEVGLRRDDAALRVLADGLLERILSGPVAEREQPLAQLLAMRSSARAQIAQLADLPEPAVRDRARSTLKAISGT